MTVATSLQTPLNNSSWQPATWAEYLQRVEHPHSDTERVFFNTDTIWIDMGNEGINHSRFNRLLTMVLFIWLSKQTDIKFELLGGCVIEKPNRQAAAPDEVLYIGGNAPRWQAGESRRVNLDVWRVPDLVVEIADTTLATDLDEKKHLYLALGILEYWVVDVRGRQVFAFQLIDGKYEQIEASSVLTRLPIALLEQTLAQMDHDNGNAALWFASQLQNLG